MSIIQRPLAVLQRALPALVHTLVLASNTLHKHVQLGCACWL